jgi:hypothetical protein
MSSDGSGASSIWKLLFFVVVAFVVGWALAAVTYTGSQPPVLRKIRVFNPSKDVIKKIDIKAKTLIGLRPAAQFENVEPEQIVAKDADSGGFLVDEEMELYATNVNEIVVTIYMADSEVGEGVALPDITLVIPEGAFEEVCVIVDDHEGEKTWRVRAVGFHQTHDEEPLISEEPLPALTVETVGS